MGALQYPRCYSTAGTVYEMAHGYGFGAVGALGTPAAELCPRPAIGKEFPSNLLFD